MIWFAIILAIVIGGVVGLFTRNLKKALVVGSATLFVGVLLSFLIIYSGIMGGYLVVSLRGWLKDWTRTA